MSQRDLVAELRGSRVAAPAELRAHIRSVAASSAASAGPRFTWRRALVVALPAAAAIAAVLVVTRPEANQSAVSDSAAQTALRAEKTLAAPPTAQAGAAGAARLAPQTSRDACSSTAHTSRSACRRRTASRTASSAH